MNPKVHNKHHRTAPPDAVYIGRGSPYGNPFSHMSGTKATHQVSSRAEAIQRFEDEVLPTLDVSALRGKHLVCFCKPQACHGDSILKKANQQEGGKPAHVWKYGAELGLQPSSKLYDQEMCKNCGVLRGDPKYPETACKGNVHVTTRSA